MSGKKQKNPKRFLIRTVMLLLLTVYLSATGYIGLTLYQNRISDKLYEDAVRAYIQQMSQKSDAGAAEEDGENVPETAEAGNTAPICVDFKALQAVNSDIVGWIYCEGTAINYPVLHGENNNVYLRNTYDGSHNTAGSIFVEALNRKGFEDSNTIIYGHHMRNGSMFACLDQWQEQEFYEEHPQLWLLTPEQDYKIVLFSGYTTSGYSDTYTVFTGACKELEEYLQRCLEQSDFQADVPEETITGKRKYVVLSTCAYVFENARYVLHGVLEEAESAGGVPF